MIKIVLFVGQSFIVTNPISITGRKFKKKERKERKKRNEMKNNRKNLECIIKKNNRLNM